MPEAFGLMALVNVVLIGLQMMSDAGINSSIIRSPRGGESEFQKHGLDNTSSAGTITLDGLDCDRMAGSYILR